MHWGLRSYPHRVRVVNVVGPDVEAKFSCTCRKHVISTGAWLVFYPKNDEGFWMKLSMCLTCGPGSDIILADSFLVKHPSCVLHLQVVQPSIFLILHV